MEEGDDAAAGADAEQWHPVPDGVRDRVVKRVCGERVKVDQELVGLREVV